MKINFSPPDITQEEIEEVIDTLKSGWITTGPKTKLFENKITEYCNSRKTACLSSATAALELSLRAVGIGEGDEVITSAYTYTSSASVITHVGATPILVDCEKDGYHIDYDEVEKAITKKTKAIIPVDIAGVMCDYKRLIEIAEIKKSLFSPNNDRQASIGRVAIVADAAHSFGAKYDGAISGNASDITCFSFHAVKNLTTAEGGALTINNRYLDADEMYKELMLLSLHGQSKDALAKMNKVGSWEYDILYPAYKYNMTDINASIGLVQLKRYDELLAKRKYIVEAYNAAFEDCNVRPLKHYTDRYSSSGHLYMLNLNGYTEERRNAFIEALAEESVPSNVHYKPLPMLTAYKKLGFDISDYPHANNSFKSEITLPLHSLLSDEQLEYIIFTARKVIENG